MMLATMMMMMPLQHQHLKQSKVPHDPKRKTERNVADPRELGLKHDGECMVSGGGCMKCGWSLGIIRDCVKWLRWR